jgi:LCP family protein required for cell wall assembly
MRRLRRVISLLIFRVLPVLLVVGILWFGWQAVQSIGRVIGEQNVYQQRVGGYAATATALVPTAGTPNVYKPSDWLMSNRVQVVDQAFVTNTPRPDGQPLATNTPLPTSTPEAPDAVGATATLPAPVDGGPLPTILFADSAAEGLTYNGTAVPTSVPAIDRKYNLTNILLLGQDNEITGESLARTDTMIVLSINNDTGTVNMLTLPRDLYVYFPNGTMGRLNVGFGLGENIGWTGGGFFFMRQTLLYNLGINVHYYALVDLSGFAEAIDILGGVDLAVDCAIQDLPLIGAEVPKDAVKFNDEGFYVLPVGYYSMTGKEALWYARSRHNSDDFDRGRRQQVILRAAWRKAKENGLLTQLPQLWSKGTEIIKTDIGFNEMVSLLPLALSLNPNQIQHLRLIRTYHTTPWQTPDGDYVQIPNPEPIFDLMTDFYTPPTLNQVAVDAAQIRVLNGTTNANWDRVAAERLLWDSMGAFAEGTADKTDYPSTMIIDYTGETKGSSLKDIAQVLNVKPENIIRQPDPNRTADFEVIIGADYNSCTFAVLPPQ